MKALLIMLVGLLVLLLPVAAVRAEDNEAPVVVRQYLVGAGSLCTLNIPKACPDVAMASNGDRIGISGQGTFTVQDNDNNEPETEIITGGGTFMHNDSAGNILATGTWTATELLSFTSFGTNPAKFPANFEGGIAAIEIHLSPAAGGPGLDAVLEVTCLVGSPPTGAVEGITLSVEDGPSFNTAVSGITLFILQS